MIEVAVKRLRPGATLPDRTHPDDAGFDLACCEPVQLAPGERVLVPTGIAVALPDGYAGYVQPRSGLAARHGIAIVNSPGLIDSGYRGEVKVILLNTDREHAFAAAAGDRIAQLVVLPAPAVRIVEVAELAESARGSCGFGSTGR